MDVETPIEKAFALAVERYAESGVSVEAALAVAASIPVSLQCWQGDDVAGFEGAGDLADGGLAVTGRYPGRARTPDELREDLSLVLRLVPGAHRINLHAMYAEPGPRSVPRDELAPEHFATWMEWARKSGVGLDMNPTFFAHPLAADGLTLSHPEREIREFWIRHGVACRRIGAAMGEATQSACVTNVWIPDGSKDTPADRRGPRERLAESLDGLFAEEIDPALNLDAVESKLFGIGSESFVVGSHEFYLGYAIRRGKLLCLDTGHFHPTESVADKISAVLTHLDRILLHVSRGVRWDSDHVVTLSDDLTALAREIVHGGYLDRVHIGLDYFDASINRIAAWTIGARNMRKALLTALLDPLEDLRKLEAEGDLTGRLALMEEAKTMPFGAVWDYLCLVEGAPSGPDWLDVIRAREREVRRVREGNV